MESDTERTKVHDLLVAPSTPTSDEQKRRQENASDKTRTLNADLHKVKVLRPTLPLTTTPLDQRTRQLVTGRTNTEGLIGTQSLQGTKEGR